MSLFKDIVKFNSQTAARDKIFRIIQYGSKLLLLQLTYGSPDINGNTVDKLRKLEAALGLSRKLFRMGNVIDFAHKTLDALSLPNSYLKILTVNSQACKGLWLLIDHLLWFGKVGVVKIDLAYWTKWSLRAWLVALLSATISDFLKISRVHDKIASHKKQHGNTENLPGELQVEMRSVRMNFWRDFCDLFIPLGGLQFISPGIAAACGTVSSFIGFQQEWERHISPFQPSLNQKSHRS